MYNQPSHILRSYPSMWEPKAAAAGSSMRVRKICKYKSQKRITILLLHQISVDPIAKLFDGRITLTMQNDRLVIIRNLTLRLCINPHHITFFPDMFHQLLQVPLLYNRRSGNEIRTTTKGKMRGEWQQYPESTKLVVFTWCWLEIGT